MTRLKEILIVVVLALIVIALVFWIFDIDSGRDGVKIDIGASSVVSIL